ncbi:Kazal-type serine protease inhibitor domain-containing protein [Rhizobium sp. ZW T2_16]|uniref:Kazal-type serine protease inhibitor domain-containing protein n=1 Tax=Rhizobium sp. ZW T2_16 TaxID=3378083 RepID=UPI0038553D69
MSFISTHMAKLPLLILLPLLSACVEGGPPSGPGGYYPPPRPDRGPQMCTMDYRPVCGERGGRLETFGNSCQANARGFRVVGSGECRAPGRPDRPDWDRPGNPGRPQPGGICTREYRPVCGQRGGRNQTFPNACEANNAGFGIISSGECRR